MQGLSKREVYSAWELVQQCFVHITPIHYKEKNEEPSQVMLEDSFIEVVAEPKKFSRNRRRSRKKSTTATRLVIELYGRRDMEYFFKDCAPIADFKPLDSNIFGYGQGNVEHQLLSSQGILASKKG